MPWHPRKRFVHDLFSVSPGMSVDDVERIMGGYMKGQGRKWVVPPGAAPLLRAPGEPVDAGAAVRAEAARAAYVPPDYPAGQERAHATGTMTYRWSDDAAYDSDFGQVQFRDGR